MFSGIIREIGEIKYFSKKKDTLGIRSNLSNLILGESISCSGVCLTVSKINNDIFFCNLSKETLEKTNFGMIKEGDKINLEKSLKMGDEISGHLVFGHVDGLSKIKKITDIKNSKIIEFNVPNEIIKFLSPKCSICLDGISLTVNKVKKRIIDVSIIPHTWENTSLKFLNEGSLVNTEVDMLARYVFKALKK
tara:strand:- start:193 stop:768 length:576 start_codon:yes stop_codon:yes gene_type:complete